jgi:flagellar biosynthesis protein FlgN
MSNALLELLKREHAATGQFLELLSQEAQAMTEGVFAELPGLAERKSRLAEQISAMGRQREALQQSLGYGTGRGGADAAAAAGNAALMNAWQQLLALATQAKALNHRNGVMVHTHLDFTRQTLNFLKAGGQPLYGPDGTHQSGGSGNRLAIG